MSDIEYDEQVKTKSRKKLKPPQSYKVLLHNDNYTTMEFVVFVLETVFSKSLSEATRIIKTGLGYAVRTAMRWQKQKWKQCTAWQNNMNSLCWQQWKKTESRLCLQKIWKCV